MGLEDRIEEEMVVDSASLMEDQFDRAVSIFKILEDGTVELKDEYRDLPAKPKLLAYLVGQTYACQTGRTESDTLSYQFFYRRFDVDDSHIRHIANDLEDDGLIETANNQSEKRLVNENIARAIDAVEDSVE